MQFYYIMKKCFDEILAFFSVKMIDILSLKRYHIRESNTIQHKTNADCRAKVDFARILA